MHNNPGLRFMGFDQLKVLKGVTLKAGECLKLQVLAGAASANGNQDLVEVELRAGQTLHARARLVLAFELDRAPGASLTPATGEYAPGSKKIYQAGRLFHGPRLQGIESVEACDDQGIVATVASAPKPGQWMQKPLRSNWLADPLALDVAFQLMILWSLEQLGAGSLPTRVGRYRQYRQRFPEQDARIVIAIKQHSEHQALADIEFLDHEGELVARIEDYECVVDASLSKAFDRNQLTSKA